MELDAYRHALAAWEDENRRVAEVNDRLKRAHKAAVIRHAAERASDAAQQAQLAKVRRCRLTLSNPS